MNKLKTLTINTFQHSHTCLMNNDDLPSGGCIHMMSSLLGIHCSDGSEHVATVSPTRTRSVSQE